MTDFELLTSYKKWQLSKDYDFQMFVILIELKEYKNWKRTQEPIRTN